MLQKYESLFKEPWQRGAVWESFKSSGGQVVHEEEPLEEYIDPD